MAPRTPISLATPLGIGVFCLPPSTPPEELLPALDPYVGGDQQLVHLTCYVRFMSGEHAGQTIRMISSSERKSSTNEAR
ncbi:hypothetical protein AVEN_172317-1 [Araneus ventricosus]|uniref:Uncharacterized protein n=1 Tax=Araneus ventricosus TaxID=182803 RepID=A0A4Y2E2S4_ARAVE|nr:hypothetical protein AVEN_172317-1 [Araneus ventricosus]